MTKRNERTSKPVASKAGKFLARNEYTEDYLDQVIDTLEVAVVELKGMRRVLRDARSLAASCLTQTEPDREER